MRNTRSIWDDVHDPEPRFGRLRYWAAGVAVGLLLFPAAHGLCMLMFWLKH